MAHLIDKDALVAEIERMKVDAIQFPFEEYGTDGTCSKLLSFLDTLEEKDVDLEKEIQAFALLELEPLKIYDANVSISITMHQLYQCAKHFFELGLRVNNEKEK